MNGSIRSRDGRTHVRGLSGDYSKSFEKSTHRHLVRLQHSLCIIIAAVVYGLESFSNDPNFILLVRIIHLNLPLCRFHYFSYSFVRRSIDFVARIDIFSGRSFKRRVERFPLVDWFHFDRSFYLSFWRIWLARLNFSWHFKMWPSEKNRIQSTFLWKSSFRFYFRSGKFGCQRWVDFVISSLRNYRVDEPSLFKNSLKQIYFKKYSRILFGDKMNRKCEMYHHISVSLWWHSRFFVYTLNNWVHMTDWIHKLCQQKNILIHSDE